MAKQVSGSEDFEVEAVAREIFAATVIRESRTFTPEYIAKKAFETAEVFLAERKAYRQNTAKPKGVIPDAD